MGTLVTQARMNLAGDACRHKVVLIRVFWMGTIRGTRAERDDLWGASKRRYGHDGGCASLSGRWRREHTLLSGAEHPPQVG